MGKGRLKLHFSEGSGKKVEYEGTEYWVREFTGIVPGVWKDELMTDKAIESSIVTWHGEPIFLTHPGEPAKTPSNYRKYKVGNIFNIEYEEGLSGEAWINIDKAEKVDEEIIEKIENDEKLSVSIGFYYEMVFSSGEYEGDEYQYRIQNIVGDHLAVLLDEPPACSPEQGCAIYQKEFAKLEGNDMSDAYKVNQEFARSTARTPNYEGTERADWGSIDKDLENYVDGYYAQNPDAEPESQEEVPERIEDMPAAMKTWIANTSLLGTSDADDLDGLRSFPVVNPNTYQLNYNGLLAARRLSGNANPEQKESIMNKTAQLLEEEFDEAVENNSELKETKNILQQLFGFLRENLNSGGEMNKASIKKTLKNCEYCGVEDEKIENIDENYMDVINGMLETNKNLIEQLGSNDYSDDEQNLIEKLRDSEDFNAKTVLSTIEEEKKQREEEKENLVKKLSKKDFEKDELKDKSLDFLRKLSEKFEDVEKYKGRNSKKKNNNKSGPGMPDNKEDK